MPMARPSALRADGFDAAAAAIMTTDTVPKTAHIQRERLLAWLGMAKGAG